MHAACMEACMATSAYRHERLMDRVWSCSSLIFSSTSSIIGPQLLMSTW